MSRLNGLIRAAVLLSCSLALLPLASVVAIATPRLPGQLLAQILFKPPGDGEPDDTASGASRPNLRLCPEDAAAPSHPLTVLRPQMSSAIQTKRCGAVSPTARCLLLPNCLTNRSPALLGTAIAAFGSTPWQPWRS